MAVRATELRAAAEHAQAALHSFVLTFDPAYAAEVMAAEHVGDIPPSREVFAEMGRRDA